MKQFVLSREFLQNRCKIESVDPECFTFTIRRRLGNGETVLERHTATCSIVCYKGRNKVKTVVARCQLTDFENKKSFQISFDRIVYAWFIDKFDCVNYTIYHNDTNTMNVRPANLRTAYRQQGTRRTRIRYRHFMREDVDNFSCKQVRDFINQKIAERDDERKLKNK